jgi:hypothetical protein
MLFLAAEKTDIFRPIGVLGDCLYRAETGHRLDPRRLIMDFQQQDFHQLGLGVGRGSRVRHEKLAHPIAERRQPIGRYPHRIERFLPKLEHAAALPQTLAGAIGGIPYRNGIIAKNGAPGLAQQRRQHRLPGAAVADDDPCQAVARDCRAMQDQHTALVQGHAHGAADRV